MMTFLITLGAFLLLILAMSVGYIFRQKIIQGSCGGITALGLEKVCNCPEPCETRKAVLIQKQMSQVEKGE